MTYNNTEKPHQSDDPLWVSTTSLYFTLKTLFLKGKTSSQTRLRQGRPFPVIGWEWGEGGGEWTVEAGRRIRVIRRENIPIFYCDREQLRLRKSHQPNSWWDSVLFRVFREGIISAHRGGGRRKLWPVGGSGVVFQSGGEGQRCRVHQTCSRLTCGPHAFTRAGRLPRTTSHRNPSR